MAFGGKKFLLLLLVGLSTSAFAQVKYHLRKYKGVVVSDFESSATHAGVSRVLRNSFSKIFTDYLNISRRSVAGDLWRFTVKQRVASGKYAGWLQIEAAEYVHAGRIYRAISYVHRGKVAYFFPSGSSLRKRKYLPSPLASNVITSRFKELRYHPVFKVRLPHNGIDYRARAGTKVMSVGDGLIVNMGKNRFSGNFITIRHNTIDHSIYCHLRSFAVGMRIGRKVTQGEHIGYVGATGVATGAHLHFSFRQRGNYINPELKLGEREYGIPPSVLAMFKRNAAASLKSLP